MNPNSKPSFFQKFQRFLENLKFMKNRLQWLLPLLGSSVAGFFGRFLESEGSAILTTTCVSFFALVSFSFCFSHFRLKGPLRGILKMFLLFSAGFVGSFIRIEVIHLLGGQALPLLLGPFVWKAVVGEALPSTGPNGAESSFHCGEEDPFELDVLEESFSDSPPAGSPRRKRVNPRSIDVVSRHPKRKRVHPRSIGGVPRKLACASS
nr:hypothetical protein 206 - radish mitochondrion [Raphanus sativus]